MTEDPMNPNEVVQAEKRARRMLVEAAAIAALIEAGATQPTRVLPIMMKQLEAVHIGDGEIRVYAVDESGNVRTGPTGPMGPDELALEISRQPEWREIAWWPKSRTPGTKTGRSDVTWM